MRNLTLWCLGITLILGGASAQAGIDARMLRNPDVSSTHIAFVYAGDIWIVDRDGGLAQRLSSPAGQELFPRFSPDGTHLAFSGNYDGNTDVYVIPTTGGSPQRLTHHPAMDRLLDWTPDGSELLFASSMTSGSGRFSQIWRTDKDGGMPTRLPLAYGEVGALSADGKTLAFQIKNRDGRTWKRYRGGLAPDIWLYDMATGDARKLTDDPANDSQPMWHGDTVYFLSDRGPAMRSNIWAQDVTGGPARQITSFTDFDVHFPAIGPDSIVFEAGGRLYLMDLDTLQPREIEVEVVTDRTTLRPRTVSVGDAVSGGGISPSGKRIVLEARGEIFSVPAEHGPTRNLTQSSGSRELFPSWSPAGDRIAYWSDASGEWQLELRAADGTGEAETLTDFGPGYRFQPYWDPDGERIAFLDHTQTLHLLDVDSREITTVDRLIWRSSWPAQAGFELAWSADGRWIAYDKLLESRNSAIMLYDTESDELHQATADFYSSFQPTFDPDGDYLYCLTDRHYSPSYSDFDGTWIYANATQLAVVPLRADVASPLAPRSDEEEVAADEGDEEKSDDADTDEAEAEDSEETDESLAIDLGGFESRMVILDVDPGNFGRLAAVKGKLLYLEQPRTGSGDEQSSLKLYDFEERESETVIDGVDDFSLSADGSKVLVYARGSFAIIDPAPGQKMETKPSLAGMRATVDPKAEWRQLFDDVWRIQRDLFYDPAMHGVDWDAMRARYGALIDDCVTRYDVNYVLGELIGELNVSHSYRGGGDTEDAAREDVGLLGVNWELADGRYRIAEIIRPAAWESATRSPLDEPAVDVNEGDWVLAVNGVEIDTSRDPWAAFQGLAGQTVELTVNDAPSFDDARTVMVKTLRSESGLRYHAWIEGHRQRVDELSGGRIGYVYVPDTGIRGQSELVRQFHAQSTKDGLIIDERFNAGGQWPDRFVELLNRPRTGYVHLRHGNDAPLSGASRLGPTVMLVNSWAGSGGDAFPYVFRRAGIGPIIGTRTWGGLVGISGAYPLMDGGMVTVPTLALYTPEGEWMLEGHGLEPDIEVVNDPASMARGGDPQIERAVQEILRELETNPIPVHEVPDPGDRTGPWTGWSK
jgi:tricorn protease